MVWNKGSEYKAVLPNGIPVFHLLLLVIILTKQHLTCVGISKKTSDLVVFLLLLIHQTSGILTLSDR